MILSCLIWLLVCVIGFGVVVSACVVVGVVVSHVVIVCACRASLFIVIAANVVIIGVYMVVCVVMLLGVSVDVVCPSCFGAALSSSRFVP